MIDIFEEEDPMIYCADIEVSALIPIRGKKLEKRTLIMNQEPITLLNGKIPSEKIKKRLFGRVYKNHINKSEFEKITFKVEKIYNVKFLSKLCYKFNPVIH
jgi:hypothetical protein